MGELSEAIEAVKFLLAIVLGIIGLFILIILTFIIHKPKISITDLYVPGLKTSIDHNATGRATFIFIDLELENSMPLNGMRYADVKLIFFYGRNRTNPPVANYTAPAFYQGHGKTANRRVVLQTVGLPWDDAFRQVSNGSKVVFGVNLVTKVKLKWGLVYVRKNHMVVGGDIEVDGSGEKVGTKAIRLISQRPT